MDEQPSEAPKLLSPEEIAMHQRNIAMIMRDPDYKTPSERRRGNMIAAAWILIIVAVLSIFVVDMWADAVSARAAIQENK